MSHNVALSLKGLNRRIARIVAWMMEACEQEVITPLTTKIIEGPANRPHQSLRVVTMRMRTVMPLHPVGSMLLDLNARYLLPLMMAVHPLAVEVPTRPLVVRRLLPLALLVFLPVVRRLSIAMAVHPLAIVEWLTRPLVVRRLPVAVLVLLPVLRLLPVAVLVHLPVVRPLHHLLTKGLLVLDVHPLAGKLTLTLLVLALVLLALSITVQPLPQTMDARIQEARAARGSIEIDVFICFIPQYLLHATRLVSR
jgi:hypothetical protein